MSTSLSAHTRLALVPRMEALDLTRRAMAVLPDTAAGRLHVLDPADPGRDCETALSEVSFAVETDTPFGAPVVLVLDLLYRDAANYKTGGTFTWQGTLTEPALDTIATALMGLAPAAFGEIGDLVPDAFDLPHLASLFDGGGPDMDGDDHVWHSVESLTLRPVAETGDPGARRLDDLHAAARAVLPRGFDLEAAMMRYTSW